MLRNCAGGAEGGGGGDRERPVRFLPRRSPRQRADREGWRPAGSRHGRRVGLPPWPSAERAAATGEGLPRTVPPTGGLGGPWRGSGGGCNTPVAPSCSRAAFRTRQAPPECRRRPSCPVRPPTARGGGRRHVGRAARTRPLGSRACYSLESGRRLTASTTQGAAVRLGLMVTKKSAIRNEVEDEEKAGCNSQALRL